MAFDHTSETTTYVTWREEQLWKVGVPQKVQLSNLVPQHVIVARIRFKWYTV